MRDLCVMLCGDHRLPNAGASGELAMSDEKRMTGKQIGLGAVDLLLAVLLVAAAVYALHGRAGPC